MIFRQWWAFYKRDFQLALTYRFSFFYGLLQTMVTLTSFFLIGKLVTANSLSPYLSAYGGDYFRFVLLGIVFSGLMGTALGGLNQTLSFEKGGGTLEAILLTPTSLMAVAFGKILWEFTLTVIKAGVYLLVGVYFFKVNLSQANWMASLFVSGLTIAAFLGLGMISAGSYLVWREAGPLEFFIGGISRFLAGVYFPVAVFPDWLRTAASWMPFTYALEALRKSLILGSPLSGVGKELTVLLCFSLSFLTLGYFFFRWAWTKARREGTLGFV